VFLENKAEAAKIVVVETETSLIHCMKNSPATANYFEKPICD
jgi:hypothetical protein